MALLSWLDHVARLVRPETATSGWVLLVVAAVVLVGVRRQGRTFWPGAGLGAYLILSSLAIALVHIAGTPPSVFLPPAVLAVGALGWWLARGQGWTDALPEAPPCPARALRLVLVVIVAVAAGCLAVRLTTYSGSLMTWEPSVIEGFGSDLRDGVSVSSFAAQRLLWQEGLVSSSDDSLLFGVPVFTLWRVLQPSLVTLRLVALVWALVALVGVFALGRRTTGATAGLVAAAALGSNALFFYYGRYGVSLTATLAAVLVAAWLTMRLADPKPRPWWQGAFVGVAMLAATLAYSPARLVVLTLLGLVVLWAGVRWRPWSRRHALVLGALGGVLAAGVAVQVATGHTGLYSHARGEQLFNILTHPDYARDYLGYDVRGRSVTVAEAVRVVLRVVERTLPQYIKVLAPVPRFDGLAEQAVLSDPPALPLLAAPLVPFALLGLARSLRRWRLPADLLLMAWFGGSSAVLLLTTRADVHRMWLLVVPLTIWAADGLLVLWRLAVAAGLSPRVRGLAAGGLGVGLLVTAVAYAIPREPPVYTEASALIAELEKREGPFIVSGDWDQREMGRVELYLLARFSQEPTRRLPPLAQALVQALAAEGGPRPEDLAELRHALRNGTVILGPLEPFAPAARRILAMGYEVQPCAGTPARAWCIERSERPARPQVTLPTGPEVPLSSLIPVDTQVGFEPPRLDEAWAGGPIRLAGIPYERGIGMHARCRMTFPVPEGALYFRSLVGIDDSARECAQALVMVSVLGDDDAVLYESDLLSGSTPPAVVAVPVEGRRRLTLLVSEGGNGRDCDHVSWAEPVFILRAP
jgi:hypothetical protein